MFHITRFQFLGHGVDLLSGSLAVMGVFVVSRVIKLLNGLRVSIHVTDILLNPPITSGLGRKLLARNEDPVSTVCSARYTLTHLLVEPRYQFCLAMAISS